MAKGTQQEERHGTRKGRVRTSIRGFLADDFLQKKAVLKRVNNLNACRAYRCLHHTKGTLAVAVHPISFLASGLSTSKNGTTFVADPHSVD